MKWFLVPLAAIAGGLATMKVGVDGQLAKTLNESLAAVATFTSALLIALIAGLVAGQLHLPSREALAAIPWYLWMSGTIAVALIAAGIFVAPKLGAAYFTVLSVAGQVAVGLILDHYGAFAFEQNAMSWARAGGAALVIVGVVIIQRT